MAKASSIKETTIHSVTLMMDLREAQVLRAILGNFVPVFEQGKGSNAEVCNNLWHAIRKEVPADWGIYFKDITAFRCS